MPLTRLMGICAGECCLYSWEYPERSILDIPISFAGQRGSMKLLVIESWLALLFVDLTLRLRGFKTLHRLLQKREVTQIGKRGLSSEALSHAMDLACVFYFRQLSPLERSAAAALVLRRHGWPADLVLGVQIFPYESYAWVEVEGLIVNDNPNLPEIYQVLERC